MRIPRATYRLQFQKKFTFTDARAILPYLADLGISHIYASPIFAARSGSTHGYDVIDHNRVNPEIGTKEELEHLCELALGLGLHWIQDFVPNHMAYDSANRLLFDVLEKGPKSIHSRFFDIEWNPPEPCLQGRILAPFLGSYYTEVLEQGKIRLVLDEKGLGFRYYDHRFPLRIDAYSKLLRLLASLQDTPRIPDDLRVDLERLANGFATPGPKAAGLKAELAALGGRPELQQALSNLNGTPGNPDSFSFLDTLLRAQHYRLAFWKIAAEEINYRRFFVINDLISLRTEEWEVFSATHEFLLAETKAGRFAGVRVDHIDGLHDPGLYLQWLRKEAGDCYLAAEKILAQGESLPAWPIQGTTGYDFLGAVNGLFVAQANQSAMAKAYSGFTGNAEPYHKALAAKKRLVLRRHMHGNLQQLTWALLSAAAEDRALCDITFSSLVWAIGEIMTHFPVYRTYVDAHSFDEKDRAIIRTAIQLAREFEPDLEFEINFVGQHLLMNFNNAACRHSRSDFVMKFQQFTSPLMAKAFEDTFFYCYNKLISLNEVGCSPLVFGLGRDAFDAFVAARQAQWPHALNATATHDTKRGEDARARINVLSEIPQEWEHAAERWSRYNRPRKHPGRGEPIPDSNDEYLIYQSLIGGLPFEEAEFPAFRRRMQAFVLKAVREAKVHTGWVRNNPEYEQGCRQFLERILTESESNPFWTDFLTFQRRVAFYGVFNSLSQLVLKLACPGVPDIYQGTEFWDFNFVDPDNRRPVDFEKRMLLLGDLRKREGSDRGALIAELLRARNDGRIKMFTMHRALRARAEMPALFERGEYIPIAPLGQHQQSIVAFFRRDGPLWALVAAPRFLTRVIKDPNLPLGEPAWGETRIDIPPGAPRTWVNSFTGKLVPTHHPLKVSCILEDFPVALLTGLGP